MTSQPYLPLTVEDTAARERFCDCPHWKSAKATEARCTALPLTESNYHSSRLSPASIATMTPKSKVTSGPRCSRISMRSAGTSNPIHL